MVCFLLFFFLFQTIIPTAFRSQVGHSYLGITSRLPVARPELPPELLCRAVSANAILEEAEKWGYGDEMKRQADAVAFLRIAVDRVHETTAVSRIRNWR